MGGEYDRWYCTPRDLVGLDATRARDLIIECFFQAQHETMERRSEVMGLQPDERSVRMEAEGAVRNAFKRTGGDFANPTKATLTAVVESLAGSAGTYGTPPDIIEHHKQQIGKVLIGLPV